MIKDNILLIGCGKMGGALLGGLKDKVFSPEQIVVMENDATILFEVQKRYGCKVAKNIQTLPDGFKADVVMFAIKPQIIEEILPSFNNSVFENTIFISIVAGKTIEFFKKHLGSDASIIRSMPNLPAQVGQGATVLYAPEEITTLQKEKAESFFKAVGSVMWVKDEDLMHAVTAISGSGPAYMFYFVDCLAKAGVQLGLSEQMAMELACSTIKGSAIMIDKSGKSPDELKQSVMSAKGTTEAAINVFTENSALQNLVQKAADAANDRSKELSG